MEKEIEISAQAHSIRITFDMQPIVSVSALINKRRLHG